LGAYVIKRKATEEQIAYAKVLSLGMRIGLLMLVAMFLVYLLGILPPHIPVDKIAEYWGLPVQQYLDRAQVHPGWSWSGMLYKGDFLNFAGITFLAGITLFCFIRIIPIFFKKRDTMYGIIALLEVVVLTVAASGILRTGGH
jgi:hypothetical protein